MILINNVPWRIIFVSPSNSNLIDRTGNRTIGTTDPRDLTIYISRGLSYNQFIRVLTHELGHCVMVSYGLLSDIHRMVKPEYWVEAEEWICNYIYEYGRTIQNIVDELGSYLYYSYT